MPIHSRQVHPLNGFKGIFWKLSWLTAGRIVVLCRPIRLGYTRGPAGVAEW
jgi:hypothetical protein